MAGNGQASQSLLVKNQQMSQLAGTTAEAEAELGCSRAQRLDGRVTDTTAKEGGKVGKVIGAGPGSFVSYRLHSPSDSLKVLSSIEGPHRCTWSASLPFLKPIDSRRLTVVCRCFRLYTLWLKFNEIRR